MVLIHLFNQLYGSIEQSYQVIYSYHIFLSLNALRIYEFINPFQQSLQLMFSLNRIHYYFSVLVLVLYIYCIFLDLIRCLRLVLTSNLHLFINFVKLQSMLYITMFIDLFQQSWFGASRHYLVHLVSIGLISIITHIITPDSDF